MIYKLMSVDEISLLQQKVGYLVVKFPKSNKLFYYEGEHLFDTHGKITLFQISNGNTVQTSVQTLLVQMDYRTYQIHKLTDDADYELALAVYEQYFDKPLITEEGCFAYLLSLVIADYEAEHYPIASISTVNFIDYLLEERELTWLDLRNALGYTALNCTEAYMRYMFEPKNARIVDIVKLSHFFKLPVQAFIVGGYGD